MQISGHCLCGSVCFDARVDPNQVFVCHCTDCQIQSGGTFRTIVRAEPGTFSLTAGELKLYLKTAESGNARSLAFCPECGTPIYGGPSPGEDGFMSLRVGTIEQRAELVPKAQVWCRSSQPWLDRLSALPRIETQGGSRSSKPS